MSQLGWLISSFLVALSKIVEADLFKTNPVYVKSFTLGVRFVGQSLFLRTIKSWIFLYFLPILGWKYSCNIISYKLMQRRCSELKSCGGPPTPKQITIKPDMNFICIKIMAFCFTCPLVLLFKKRKNLSWQILRFGSCLLHCAYFVLHDYISYTGHHWTFGYR